MASLQAICTVIGCLLIFETSCQANIPLPTEPQLNYQRGEIVGLTHFNMATFLLPVESSCNSGNWVQYGSKPSTFAPTNLNISNWVESYKALGAKSAVLTAKHSCGFALWPSKVTIPTTNSVYNYSIAFSSSPLNQRDVMKEFSDILTANDIGHGYYYSLANNYFLNVKGTYVQKTKLLPGQMNLTQAQFQQVAIGQLTELFSNYGDITEFWFDGGTGNANFSAEVTQVINKYQPNAAIFNGEQVSQNMVRWIGTEAGGTSKPIWSLGESNEGDPNSSQFCPACCDTTLQNGDQWFYNKDESIRTLAQLITVYHNTVGNNCVLELDFAIDETGNVASAQAQRYKEFGDWINNCYGTSLKETNGTIMSQNGTLSLDVDNGSFDRIMLREDLSKGQRIRQFSIVVDGKVDSSSTSIGNKRIMMLSKEYSSGSTVEFVANSFVGDEAYITKFAVFKTCSSS